MGAAITVSAGVVATGGAATGGAVAAYHHAGPVPSYTVPIAGADADPYHSDPGGEWVRIESSPTMGTASTMHMILAPGD